MAPLHTSFSADSSHDYIYGPSGTPIEQVSQSSGAATYLYTDQLGSVVMEADSSGNVIGTQSYTAYGSLASSTGTDPTPFGFAGGYTDPTGLIYLINRYYEPSAGQFISVDPLIASTQQPYNYALDNPANLADHLGLSASCDCKTIHLNYSWGGPLWTTAAYAWFNATWCWSGSRVTTLSVSIGTHNNNPFWMGTAVTESNAVSKYIDSDGVGHFHGYALMVENYEKYGSFGDDWCLNSTFHAGGNYDPGITTPKSGGGGFTLGYRDICGKMHWG
ncbi:MAG TPA: RHS repeat-associated core domain-containing protein [Acidimicrobiales bacterium]|nr:RHS repeat-associated core domain-containing protein [Acidimicrobiales bacterium]